MTLPLFMYSYPTAEQIRGHKVIPTLVDWCDSTILSGRYPYSGHYHTTVRNSVQYCHIFELIVGTIIQRYVTLYTIVTTLNL